MCNLPAFAKARVVSAIPTFLMFAVATGWVAGAPVQNPVSNTPSLADVKSVVSKSLQQDRNYRTGDLITGKRVSAVLGALQASGWDVPQRRELLARVPGDGEFLVRALSTEKGVAFMRTISGISGGFDRLDRLSRIPKGEQLVERLIRGPDGHKLIVYLAESRGGKELGVMLGRTTDAADFNKPTGRIYTERQLLEELQTLYAESQK